jgi:His/Glu/Gln/Arg/opine family amino acid ABC transporter permease subunit
MQRAATPYVSHRLPAFSLAAVLLLIVLVGSTAGCRRKRSTLDKVRSSGEIVIATDATYPPFEFVRSGQITGFDIDLGNALAGELGLKAKWSNTAWDGVFPALLGGKCDLVLSCVTITEERKRSLGFSEPYYTSGQILAIRGDQTGIDDLEDLKGKTAGCQLNTTADETLKKHPDIRKRQYASIDLALQDLANRRLDAVLGDAPTIRYYINRSFTGLETAGALFTTEQIGGVMRPGDTDLRDAVNAALARLRSSGRTAAIEAHWFGTEAEAAPPPAGGLPWGDLLRTLGRGLALTLQLTLFALATGIPMGLLIALGRQSGFAPLRWVLASYVELFRGTPLLVQLIFIYYALPDLAGVDLQPFQAAVLALALNSAAYIAEIFRAGLESIDKGQMEAARSLGMTYAMAMRYVLLPQTLRRVLPPLTNEAIALLKDTSLVSIISMAELVRTGQELVGQYAVPFVIWPVVALFYLAVTYPLSRFAGALERRWGQAR